MYRVLEDARAKADGNGILKVVKNEMAAAA
jgi:hypothetical protein